MLHGLDRPLSGVTRVALELARALDRIPAFDLVVLSTSRETAALGGLRAPMHWLPGCARVPAMMVLGGPLVAVAARRFELDVVHDPTGVSPFTLGRWSGRFARVLTIHDAIAFEDPRGYAWSNNLLHRRYVPHTLRNIDAVITVSDAARSAIARFLGRAADRITVVPNGVGSAFLPVPAYEAATVAARYGLRSPFVLHVGSAQPRKNVVGLLEAFARVRRRLPDCRLALAGPPMGDASVVARAIDRLDLAAHVSSLGSVPEGHLPSLYSAARLFVLPSLFEGFGLPIIEAMACGTPVVCASIPALAETAGDAAVLVDPRDPRALADAMVRALTNETLRTSLRVQGLARARRFTWERAAEQTIEVYRRAAAGDAETS